MPTLFVSLTDRATGETVAHAHFEDADAADRWFVDQLTAYPDEDLIPSVYAATRTVEVAR